MSIVKKIIFVASEDSPKKGHTFLSDCGAMETEIFVCEITTLRRLQ